MTCFFYLFLKLSNLVKTLKPTYPANSFTIYISLLSPPQKTPSPQTTPNPPNSHLHLSLSLFFFFILALPLPSPLSSPLPLAGKNPTLIPRLEMQERGGYGLDEKGTGENWVLIYILTVSLYPPPSPLPPLPPRGPRGGVIFFSACLCACVLVYLRARLRRKEGDYERKKGGGVNVRMENCMESLQFYFQTAVE